MLDAAGQRLALDPPGADGTVGGLIATGAAGPLRYRYGSPRDLLIGITIVRPDGIVAKSGGKVVKNVAGYDIGKLFAGSLGTLGLITEATFRLHPLPEAAAWLAFGCPDSAAAATAVHAIADSPLAPAAIELDWPSAGRPISVSALLEGDAASVTERAGASAEAFCATRWRRRPRRVAGSAQEPLSGSRSGPVSWRPCSTSSAGRRRLPASIRRSVVRQRRACLTSP